MLRRKGLKSRFNQAHSLTNFELAATIERFCEEGLITRINNFCDGDVRYQITESGGHLWEMERCPVWDKFGFDRIPWARQRKEMTSFVAASVEACESFIELMCPPQARRRFWTIRNFELLSWRTFTHLHVGVAVYNTPDCILVNDQATAERLVARLAGYEEKWSRIEEQRLWWQSVGQLQKFVPVPE